MRLAHSLATVAATSPGSFEELRRNIDPEWIVQSLEATGRHPWRGLALYGVDGATLRVPASMVPSQSSCGTSEPRSRR